MKENIFRVSRIKEKALQLVTSASIVILTGFATTTNSYAADELKLLDLMDIPLFVQG